MTLSLRKIGLFLYQRLPRRRKFSLLSYKVVKISRQYTTGYKKLQYTLVLYIVLVSIPISSCHYFFATDEDETLDTMLKRVVHSLGLVEHSNENPRRKNKVKRKHHHQDKTKENIKLGKPNAVNTLPPNECRINENCEAKETTWLGEEKVNAKVNMFQGGEDAEESCFTAKEFYVSKDKSARCSRRKGIVKGKKPFVAPFPMARLYRDHLGWKPSLDTVDDLSP